MIYNVPQAHFLQWVAPTVVPIFLRDTGEMELNLIFGSIGFGVEEVVRIAARLQLSRHIVTPLQPTFQAYKYRSATSLIVILSGTLQVEEIEASIHLFKAACTASLSLYGTW